MRQLPPGKYRLSFRIAWGPGQGDEKQGYWIGEIATNPVEFEIADRETAKPVDKDGLSAAVVTRKDYYAPGEMPAVAVTLKNTTNKILTVHHPGHAVRVWSYAFTDLKNGTNWEGRYAPGLNSLPPLKLKPGDSYAIRVDFFGGEFQAVAANPARPVHELPPGQYRLTVTARFENMQLTPNDIVWSGDLQANPVEFTVLKP